MLSARFLDSAVIATLLSCGLLGACIAAPGQVTNLTGLPLYPNLTKAAMDDVARTDALGHWCARFAGETSYSLDVVEAWYRKTFVGASETDLTHDATYRVYPKLAGIKLALGRDYVTIYKATRDSATSIELFGCSPPGLRAPG